MITISVTINEEEVRKLIAAHLESVIGTKRFDPTKVSIMVKSKQNYKSEWEDAAIKATYIEAES